MDTRSDCLWVGGANGTVSQSNSTVTEDSRTAMARHQSSAQCAVSYTSTVIVTSSHWDSGTVPWPLALRLRQRRGSAHGGTAWRPQRPNRNTGTATIRPPAAAHPRLQRHAAVALRSPVCVAWCWLRRRCRHLIRQPAQSPHCERLGRSAATGSGAGAGADEEEAQQPMATGEWLRDEAARISATLWASRDARGGRCGPAACCRHFRIPVSLTRSPRLLFFFLNLPPTALSDVQAALRTVTVCPPRPQRLLNPPFRLSVLGRHPTPHRPFLPAFCRSPNPSGWSPASAEARHCARPLAGDRIVSPSISALDVGQPGRAKSGRAVGGTSTSCTGR